MSAYRPRPPIDLHTHSNVSDGTEEPRVLVSRAARAGLGTVALTDHDTTAGWSEARRAAEETGVTLVPGLELSTRYEGRSVHVLGYFVDPNDEGLTEGLHRIRSGRRRRAQAIVARLADDHALRWTDVLEQAGDGAVVGRPHIADALVARGHVASREEAFATLLHPRGGYYEPLDAPTPLEGVRLLRGAGGAAVIAHPATRGRTGVLDEEALERLVEAGLSGLEVEHRENTAEGKEYLRGFAAAHGLVTTGSSDYHGAGKDNRLGENTTTPEALAALAEAATGASLSS